MIPLCIFITWYCRSVLLYSYSDYCISQSLGKSRVERIKNVISAAVYYFSLEMTSDIKPLQLKTEPRYILQQIAHLVWLQNIKISCSLSAQGQVKIFTIIQTSYFTLHRVVWSPIKIFKIIIRFWWKLIISPNDNNSAFHL